jgi:CubicO group peptidase (beta-lactamase class C family)
MNKRTRFQMALASLVILGAFLSYSLRSLSLNSLTSPLPKAAMDEFLFPSGAASVESPTETMVIYKNDQIIYEKSKPGFNPNTPHILWSVTKSVSSVILGTLVEKNQINVNESVCQIAPQFKDQVDCRMKLSHILEWSSGLSFLEAYEGSSDRTKSSIGQMLYGDGKNDNVEFILSHRQIYEPGKHYYYSSGDSGLILGLLKNRLSPTEYKQLPFKNLFEPLGITTATFDTDLNGQWMSGSSLYMSSRDVAKIGKLMLNNGIHQGKKLVPSDWVAYTTEVIPQFVEATSDRNWIPCRQWWRPHLKNMGLDQIPNFPKDIYVGRGHWGQYLIIIPSMKIVAVRLGLDQKESINEAELLKQVVQLGAN